MPHPDGTVTFSLSVTDPYGKKKETKGGMKERGGVAPENAKINHM